MFLLQTVRLVYSGSFGFGPGTTPLSLLYSPCTGLLAGHKWKAVVRKQLWRWAKCEVAPERQFHGLLRVTRMPFPYTIHWSWKSTTRINTQSHMYSFPFVVHPVLAQTAYLRQVTAFAVGTSVEYCCTALVNKSNKMRNFFTKLSCAFLSIYIHTQQRKSISLHNPWWVSVEKCRNSMVWLMSWSHKRIP